jgi:hypothetical protein
MTSHRTWKIRDQQPDGSWGPEREVTLEQYKAEIAAAADRAKSIFKRNAEAA